MYLIPRILWSKKLSIMDDPFVQSESLPGVGGQS